jgi:rhomboid protease GluP
MYRFQPSPDNQNQPNRQEPPSPPRIAVKMPVVKPFLTFGLLALIILIFLYYLSLSTGDIGGRVQFLNDWAKVNELIKDGEYYRLFSSMFLHLNLMHIVFNGYALYIIGRDVEALFGHLRFALIYFLGGLSGSLGSFIFTSAPSVGASGAIFAIFGAEMVYFYQNRELHGAAGRRHLNQLLFIMLLNLALGFFSTTTGSFKIDNAGHIGGLIGGVVLAWFIGPSYNVTRDPSAVNGIRVVDENTIQRWALPSVLYAIGLVAVLAYALSAPA